VAADSDHGLLMILGMLDPLVQQQCVASREPTLVDALQRSPS